MLSVYHVFKYMCFSRQSLSTLATCVGCNLLVARVLHTTVGVQQCVVAVHVSSCIAVGSQSCDDQHISVVTAVRSKCAAPFPCTVFYRGFSAFEPCGSAISHFVV